MERAGKIVWISPGGHFLPFLGDRQPRFVESRKSTSIHAVSFFVISMKANPGLPGQHPYHIFTSRTIPSFEFLVEGRPNFTLNQ